MRGTRDVVEVHGGQQWDERLYAYGSLPARTQGSLRVWVSALGLRVLRREAVVTPHPQGLGVLRNASGA
jgi:hypothetical protein